MGSRLPQNALCPQQRKGLVNQSKQVQFLVVVRFAIDLLNPSYVHALHTLVEVQPIIQPLLRPGVSELVGMVFFCVIMVMLLKSMCCVVQHG